MNYLVDANVLREQDLTVVTRNVSDFSSAEVKVINPFDDHD